MKAKIPFGGYHCPKCKAWVPRFEGLSESDIEELRGLCLQGKPMRAIVRLQEMVGAEKKEAKCFVNHLNGPDEHGFVGDGACPNCGGKLRTPSAKQCPHCFERWGDG